LDDFKAKIIELEPKAAAQPPETPPQNAPSPAKTTNSTNGIALITFTKPPRTTHPWKTGIVTTLFWIGEGSAASSAWNAKWTETNNGTDSPDTRNGYASGNHASTLNPFYVALPFNDLAFPDKARQWLPPGWYRQHRGGKSVSACKDRWVEINNVEGRVCFAQWEDVGPLRNDHAEYVFGHERPADTHAGLSISPAVRNYLGIEGKSGITSWRFVEDEDVMPGQWLKLDEQAVMFRALHEQKTSTLVH